MKMQDAFEVIQLFYKTLWDFRTTIRDLIKFGIVGHAIVIVNEKKIIKVYEALNPENYIYLSSDLSSLLIDEFEPKEDKK